MTLDKVKRGFKPSYENRIPADWRGAYPLATRCVYSLRARRILQWCEELLYGSSRLQDPQVPPMGMNYCNVPQWQTSIYANRPRRSPEYTVCCMSVWKFFQYKMVGLSVVCPPLRTTCVFFQMRNNKKTAILVKEVNAKKRLFLVYRPNTGRQLKLESYADIKKKFKKVTQQSIKSTVRKKHLFTDLCRKSWPCVFAPLGIVWRRQAALDWPVPVVSKDLLSCILVCALYLCLRLSLVLFCIFLTVDKSHED